MFRPHKVIITETYTKKVQQILSKIYFIKFKIQYWKLKFLKKCLKFKSIIDYFHDFTQYSISSVEKQFPRVR